MMVFHKVYQRPVHHRDPAGGRIVAGEVPVAAAVGILERQDRRSVLLDAYKHAKADLARGVDRNRMKEIYDAVDDDELVREIARLLTPPGFQSELRIVYQTTEALRACCPEYTGDWYFTGDYPTPGGFRMVNQALVNYMEHNNGRAY